MVIARLEYAIDPGPARQGWLDAHQAFAEAGLRCKSLQTVAELNYCRCGQDLESSP